MAKVCPPTAFRYCLPRWWSRKFLPKRSSYEFHIPSLVGLATDLPAAALINSTSLVGEDKP